MGEFSRLHDVRVWGYGIYTRIIATNYHLDHGDAKQAFASNREPLKQSRLKAMEPIESIIYPDPEDALDLIRQFSNGWAEGYWRHIQLREGLELTLGNLRMLDRAHESQLYRHLQNRHLQTTPMTYISVAHRASLRSFHQIVLELTGENGGFKLHRLD
jgi:hypothetical protein